MFKPLANFERPDDALKMPKPRKVCVLTKYPISFVLFELLFDFFQRVLSTSSESSMEAESNAKPSHSTKNGNLAKKAKSQEKTSVPTKLTKKDEATGGSDSGKDTKKVIKTTTVKDMLRAKRDNMRNMVEGTAAVSSDEEGTASGSSDETDSDDENDDDDEDDVDDEYKKLKTAVSEATSALDAVSKKEPSNGNALPADEVKLPNNLPAEMLENINHLTASAKASSGGKSNFFDSKNTDLLYRFVWLQFHLLAFN